MIDVTIRSAYPNFGEEKVLVGEGGSGTIFFAGCTLKCPFCQDLEFKHGTDSGITLSPGSLSFVMVRLEQEMGCHNINLVTPNHFAVGIAAAIQIARSNGLTVPIVWNSSGYDSLNTLKRVEGLIDIYMPDFKFISRDLADKWIDCPTYPSTAIAAIQEMRRQVGDLVIEDGVAKRGLIVRHLVMPDCVDDAVCIMEFLAALSKDTFVSIMGQYRPPPDSDDRRPTREEVDAVYEAARKTGLHRFSG